jgi:ribosomal protein S18 acetylase RimI-like enzyme
MGLSWIRENPARWDGDKARIVGGTEMGIFDPRYRECTEGDLVPAEWWRVEEDVQGSPQARAVHPGGVRAVGAGGPRIKQDRSRVVGYGWLDVSWGDAEVLIAIDPEHRGRGVGTFVLDRLEEEARQRGLNYLYNVVRGTHPRAAEVRAWLSKRRFAPSEDGRLLRAVIRPSQMPPVHAR